MWSYYGAKTKVIKYYPKPLNNTIIEPFAGTARYALEYFENDVILFDNYNKIADIWCYLISASENDILSLPNMDKLGDDLRDMTLLSDVEKWLIGFCIGRGSARPRNKCGQFNSWPKDKIRIAKQLYKIRHWKIVKNDYTCIGNFKATWFIDPPYQVQVHRYSKQILDYDKLSSWCQEREGQVIVCENEGGKWLPFKPLIVNNGISKTTTEYIYHIINNEPKNNIHRTNTPQLP